MKIEQFSTNLARRQFWESSTLEVRQGFQENNAICLYPNVTEHRFLGFGGAFTEAAAYTWSSLSEQNKQEVLEAYFGQDGLRYTLGRTHMNSCDFALGNYACLGAPNDVFQTERDKKYLLPMIKAADSVADRKLQLMLSPWSPPAFMKTNEDMNHGGKLKPEYRKLWAECMARYIQEYRRAGLAVRFVSVQNEPNAVQSWDSCIYSAEDEADFAANALYPALCALALEDTEILIWDHNKDQLLDRMERSFAVPAEAKCISGAAFHWYSGDHFEAVSLARRLYPNKTLLFSEGCVEYSRFGGMTDLDKAEMYAHDIIGNLKAGANGSIDWNLLLDAKGGPNHVGNFCEAPLMATADGGIQRNGSYYYIGHFSRFIQPGAVKIGLSTYTSDLEAMAFSNLNGSIAVVVLNRSSRDHDTVLRLSRDKYAATTINAHSIVSFLVK